MLQTPSPARQTSAAEYTWWGSRCPLEVLGDTLRGRPEKKRALIFLAAVWLHHRDRCRAS